MNGIPCTIPASCDVRGESMTMLERSVNEARSPVDAQVASVLDKRDGWLTLERSVISKRQE